MHVTVCICTRNRGASIGATLRSIAASRYTDFDVLMIDQSTTEDTAQAIQAEVGGDERFNYIHSPTKGKSVALNACLKLVRGPIIAFTDDDCEVQPDWLSALVNAFEQHPEVGEVCGTVEAVPYDTAAGYTPVYIVKRAEQIRSCWRLWRAGGIGANMAFRKEVLHAVGGFDEVLGPGGPLYNGEDVDITCRVLKAGYTVFNIPEAVVLHNGYRSWADDGKVHLRHAYLSAGSAYMKYLRLGTIAVLPTILHDLLYTCIHWKDLFLFRWHKGLGVRNLLSYMEGMRVSFRYGIDRRRSMYAPRSS